ncbi:hypothetical protein SAMN05421812_101188 [Asanoa hainanensis]|uniref:Methylamine utilisation protein MauE domain-containing protein n=1 Tax=Asanoa hainanensis TaxID=560556 RepID=A0A239G240_9ACTN|nr:MauE/DoxX family redox-associated membrane protein [Asanoa hainanensis]SNS63110.1 hypothetical protein SAMN05421812_101188 [Asanoa hainanensis]
MYVEVVTRTALLVVFGVAAVQKGRSQAAFLAFVSALRSFGLGGAARPVGYAVVAAETVAALLLAWPHTVTAGYLLALALLTVFMAGIVRASRSPTPVACRCFGFGGGPLGIRHLIRNAVLGGMAVVGLLADRGPVDAGAALAAIGGLFVALVVIRWDDLAYLMSATRR